MTLQNVPFCMTDVMLFLRDELVITRRTGTPDETINVTWRDFPFNSVLAKVIFVYERMHPAAELTEIA